jgi:3'-5' exoribonuclease
MSMDKVYVSALGSYINDEITSFFLVNEKELRESAKKDLFLRLRLSDKSGNVAANIWNNAKKLKDNFEEGDVVKVKGIVISYKGQTQLTINNIRKADEVEYDLSEFMPQTNKNVNSLSDMLFHYIDNTKDEYIQKLLQSIFGDKEFLPLFMRAPAAKSWHHNYLGGLLEHTVSVARICDFASHLYPVQTDFLIAGALLHDIGKVYEYNTKTVIDFSTVGRLIGHICLGDQLICDKARDINEFPANTLMKLRHLILSHHGEYEKAAARLPQTLEAIVLHYADNLDAQSVGVTQLVEASLKADSEWSEFDRIHERYFYLG